MQNFNAGVDTDANILMSMPMPTSGQVVYLLPQLGWGDVKMKSVFAKIIHWRANWWMRLEASMQPIKSISVMVEASQSEANILELQIVTDCANCQKWILQVTSVLFIDQVIFYVAMQILSRPPCQLSGWYHPRAFNCFWWRTSGKDL